MNFVVEAADGSSPIFAAHSGLRYLVLAAAAVAVLVLAAGLLSRRAAYDRPARIATAAFTGLLDLQIVLGIVVVLGRFSPVVIGHIMMMVLAAVVAHGASALARRQPDARRAYSLALVGVLLAVGLIVGGIMAIGRGVFQSTV